MTAFQRKRGRNRIPRIREDQRVTRAEAERRVLEVLKRDRGTTASCVADAIWPGHDMKPQAAALAAGGILGRMRRRRLVGYDPDGHGWVKR